MCNDRTILLVSKWPKSAFTTLCNVSDDNFLKKNEIHQVREKNHRNNDSLCKPSLAWL